MTMNRTTTGAKSFADLIPTTLAQALEARLAANKHSGRDPQSMVDLLAEAAASYESGRTVMDNLGYTHPPASYPDIVAAAMTAYLP